jgi:hypothetical protein
MSIWVIKNEGWVCPSHMSQVQHLDIIQGDPGATVGADFSLAVEPLI